MSYYFACVRTKSVLEGDPTLIDESIILVTAEDEQAAYEKAEAIGRRDVSEYKNEDGETVSWQFIEIVNVQQFCEKELLVDGAEVYSRMYWEDDEEEPWAQRPVL